MFCRHQDPSMGVSSLDPNGLESGQRVEANGGFVPGVSTELKLKAELDPEPAYIHEELPEDPQKLSELLQKELARRAPNRDFIRSVLRRSNYEISKELRCRTYAVLLDVDSSLVKSLADNTWSVNTVNSGIIEDYLRHIYPAFSENGT